MENEMIVRKLKALGDPTRLHIVQFLHQSCCSRATVNEEGGVLSPTAGEVCCHITGAEKITSTVSHHLHELASAGFIKLERNGKTMQCALVPKAIEALGYELISLSKGKNDACC